MTLEKAELELLAADAAAARKAWEDAKAHADDLFRVAKKLDDALVDALAAQIRTSSGKR